MWFPVVLATALAVTVLGQEFASDCPTPNGLFADSLQCDLYYECRNNIITEKLCPDGKAFNDRECDFNSRVDCSERPDLQPALNDPNCPRANGNFPHPDNGKCNVYNNCHAGRASLVTCPEGLVFSSKIGACTWPAEAGRSGCDTKDGMNFTCPIEAAAIAASHPLYSDPDDCQFYYVCVSGVTPRHHGCKFGEVFSNETKTCAAPYLVPGCDKYYWDYFAEYFETLGAGSTRSSTEVLEAAVKSDYPVPENARNQLRQPTETSSAPDSPVRSSPISPASKKTNDAMNFNCPNETAAIAASHPLYSDPEDCQFYYLCISGITPRHHGCKFGEVFSNDTKACDAPSLVPGCENYYWDYFAEYFETLGNGFTRSSTEVIEAALKSNYPVPKNAKTRLTKPQISHNRRRKPTQTSSAPDSPVRGSSRPTIPARSPIAATPEQPAPVQAAAPRPQRPLGGTRVPIRRRRPGAGVRRRVTTTTTTTTTTPPPPTTISEPEYYYDYYYDDETAAQPVQPAPAPSSESHRFRN